MSGALAEHVHPEWEDFGAVEWTLVAAASLFVAWTIYKAVQYTFRPGEGQPEHVKRVIFEPEDTPVEGVSSVGRDDPSS